MPNIVQQLMAEIARVQGLVATLGEADQRQAETLLRYGRQSMALNRYEEMREALDDLATFGNEVDD